MFNFQFDKKTFFTNKKEMSWNWLPLLNNINNPIPPPFQRKKEEKILFYMSKNGKNKHIIHRYTHYNWPEIANQPTREWFYA